MHALAPLPVAIPLCVAAILAGLGRFLPRRAIDLATLAAVGAAAGVSATLAVGTADGPVHVAFGGWEPHGRLMPGIAFMVDPLAASLAALAGVLCLAAIGFAWRYFDEVTPLFHVLVLCFLAGMIGFALSDDLFNLFVFFQLMGIAAFALTGFRVGESAPLQGALWFGVLNTLAGSLLVLGLALVYARTGALNLLDAGDALARRPPDALVAIAFGLLVAGFLVKAGVPPFHFWLADAYSAAPVPVCVLLSGVMSDLGIHAISRVHAETFSGAFAAHEDALRLILVALGVAGALLMGVMAFLQAELKRMLAFLTSSHAAAFLAGVALFTPAGLGGTTIWVVTDGLAKGALFLTVGVIAQELGDGDELRLRGRGRALPWTGGAYGLAAAAILLAPPFGTFLGFALTNDSADAEGLAWVPPLLVLASAVCGAAVVRAGARVFLGLGAGEDPLLTSQPQSAESQEPDQQVEGRPWLGIAPSAGLAVAALGLAFAPGLADHAVAAAAHAQDREALVRSLFEHVPVPALHVDVPALGARAYAYGAATVLAALALAAAGLWRQRLPAALRAPARFLVPPLEALRAVHSGVLGDYVAWMTAGTTVVVALFVAFAR